MLNSDSVYGVVSAGLKTVGIDTDLSKYMGGLTQGIVIKAKKDLETKKKHSKWAFALVTRPLDQYLAYP